MEPGYYYLTQHDGHRSILGIGENSLLRVSGEVAQIVDEQVLAYLHTQAGTASE